MKYLNVLSQTLFPSSKMFSEIIFSLLISQILASFPANFKHMSYKKYVIFPSLILAGGHFGTGIERSGDKQIGQIEVATTS